jgi:hypothetical protein
MAAGKSGGDLFAILRRLLVLLPRDGIDASVRDVVGACFFPFLEIKKLI